MIAVDVIILNKANKRKKQQPLLLILKGTATFWTIKIIFQSIKQAKRKQTTVYMEQRLKTATKHKSTLVQGKMARKDLDAPQKKEKKPRNSANHGWAGTESKSMRVQRVASAVAWNWPLKKVKTNSNRVVYTYWNTVR